MVQTSWRLNILRPQLWGGLVARPPCPWGLPCLPPLGMSLFAQTKLKKLKKHIPSSTAKGAGAVISNLDLLGREVKVCPAVLPASDSGRQFSLQEACTICRCQSGSYKARERQAQSGPPRCTACGEGERACGPGRPLTRRCASWLMWPSSKHSTF